MSAIQIGDRVILTTDRYDSSAMNPRYDKTGIKGNVTRIVYMDRKTRIYVKWDTGRNNGYDVSDLEVADNIIIDVDDLFSEIDI